jgi:cytosine/adenosine deaminase-related metal-dependent hydrolase
MRNALTREEALRAMTIWAAYANFEEKEKGSLEKGKLADFVVLDKDIMTIPVSRNFLCEGASDLHQRGKSLLTIQRRYEAFARPEVSRQFSLERISF